MIELKARPEFLALKDSEIRAVWQMGFSIPDVVGFWVGESDIPTPPFICDAAAKALGDGKTFYTHQRGIPELRKALIDYHQMLYGIDIEDGRVAITSAGMNAVMVIVQSLISPGDNLIAISPVWPNILRCTEIMGGEAREVALDASPQGWSLDIEKLFASVDDRTKAIYLATPGNPTGWIIDEADRQALLEFARRRKIAIIADEVYNRLIYDRLAAPSFLEIAMPDDPLFIINSFSKTWCMTGWRLGWMILPKGMESSYERLIGFNTSGAQPFLQEAAIIAIREGEAWVKQWVERCRCGRDYVIERLSKMNRVSIIPSNASFYFMLQIEEMGDSVEFCKKMVMEAKVGLAPGTAFGKGGENFVRLCYAQSDDKLKKGMDRLENYLRNGSR